MGADLELVAGGRALRFPPVWLRDNCPCPECLDPGTGQKRFDITGLPNGLGITLVEDVGESVLVTFGPDQHTTVFSRAWLAAHALDGDGGSDGDGRTEDDKQLWLPADLAGLPALSWSGYLAGGKVQALAAVLRLGFVLLRDVPAEPGTVLDVAASFGYVRETNYGRLFDVRVEPAPGNLAYTSEAIRPHTDNPYRDPAPTVQLLHCLRAAGEGGDTGLVDGFAAAAELRATDAESFATLARTPVPFGYVDKETELRARRRPYAEVTAFYAAYRRWSELLAWPERQLSLRLAPGDCLVFDNTRGPSRSGCTWRPSATWGAVKDERTRGEVTKEQLRCPLATRGTG